MLLEGKMNNFHFCKPCKLTKKLYSLRSLHVQKGGSPHTRFWPPGWLSSPFTSSRCCNSPLL